MEVLDIVDENGTPTGETVERGAAHLSGIRHRTSHVWFLRKRSGKAQVLLQKRSLNKDSRPECYDTSNTGHVPSGGDLSESPLRELKGEPGITAAAEELTCYGCCRSEYRGILHEQSFWDNQVNNVYILWRDIEKSEFALQESEADSVLWTDQGKCLDMVKHKGALHYTRINELELIFSSVPLLDESGQSPATPLREH